MSFQSPAKKSCQPTAHLRSARLPAASSQDVLLRRMAFLQQQLLEWEDEAATLHGDLAHLARPASLQGNPSPSPSDVESSSFTGVL